MSKYLGVLKAKRTELKLKVSNFSDILRLEVSMSPNDPEILTWIRVTFHRGSEQLVQCLHQIQNTGKSKLPLDFRQF